MHNIFNFNLKVSSENYYRSTIAINVDNTVQDDYTTQQMKITENIE